MPDGRYTLCGEEVQMHGGVVRTASGGLAGSTLSVDAAVRNMVELTGRNACGSHPYGVAASGANAGC
ncbi:N-acetylgalactosamine-6-phosphate deacetylase [Escherichia coli]|uniref:N-acetylgalactosamine-6-phosphate deacetylase n=1 Tax=Escherichia coli TaxID=562 RepID=A0A377C2J2_ECOLX|nr:N-acetylgalactosamine-6-phosphate deacetylase [Escherichia coli]